jgi:uncharacterized repeat protein (TIGR02543 family)
MRTKFLRTIALALSLSASFAAFASCSTQSGEVSSQQSASSDAGKNTADSGSSTGGQNTNNSATNTNKTVSSIEVADMPSKTEYVIGETFSWAGGTIKVIYSDGTNEVVSMESDIFKLTAASTAAAGEKKTARVRLVADTSISVTFTVKVSSAQYTVTFDYNYDGAAATTQTVGRNSTVDQPTVPAREGYTFVKWYANADYTTAYDFETGVTGDITLYAFWTKDGATYQDVTFDYNYYGKKLDKYSYPVEVGAKVARPTATPEREGYAFVGWYTDEAGTTEYNFDETFTTPVTVYAKWNKTATEQTYTFEAEDTDLSGKVGPSYSGTAVETSMIVYSNTLGASNDRYIDYLYQKDLSLEFYIACDEDVTGVTLIGSFAAFLSESYTFNKDNFAIIVNGQELNYQAFTVTKNADEDKGQFSDFTLYSALTLKKGANTIQLKVNNSAAIAGTTYKAYAPLVDCIKLTTSAVVTWDENYGLPQSNY